MFPILTLAAIFLAPAAATPNRVQTTAVTPTLPGAAQATDDPQRLVANAAAAIGRMPSVSAKIRQRVDLFGHQLVGSGSYLQLGTGAEMLLRLELKIQTDHVTSLQQICDGRFFWLRRDLIDKISLSRIDLRRVRQAIKQSRGSLQPSSATGWMALGGLPKLMESLDANFRFNEVRASQLRGLPVWVVRGRWKPEKLANLLPDQKDAILAGNRIEIDRSPAHLPTLVTVVVGQEDLFPYRITYERPVIRADRDSRAGPDGETKPIVTMELFEVRVGAPIDPLQFVYQPGDLEVADHTKRYLRSIGIVE